MKIFINTPNGKKFPHFILGYIARSGFERFNYFLLYSSQHSSKSSILYTHVFLQALRMGDIVDALYFLHIAERIIIVEGRDVVYIVWTPVDGAEQYRLQFLEKDNIFYNITTRTASFNFSLSDSRFEGKTFSVRVSVLSVKATSA